MTTRIHPGEHKLYLTRAQRVTLNVHAGSLVWLARPNDSALKVEVLMPSSVAVFNMNDRGIAQLVLLHPNGNEADVTWPFVTAIAEMLRDDDARDAARRDENSIVVNEPDDETAEPAIAQDDPDEDDDFNWRTTA